MCSVKFQHLGQEDTPLRLNFTIAPNLGDCFLRKHRDLTLAATQNAYKFANSHCSGEKF